MKRSEPLRADPDKTRAWQERSRATAAENARERVQGREGIGSSLRRSATAPSDFRDDAGRVISPMQRAAAQACKGPDPKPRPVRFRAPSPARDELCPTCLLQGVRRRAASWHHWLPQSQIRVYVRGLRLPDLVGRRRLGRLLRDRRNLTAFCADHHGAHGTRSHDFVRAQVPDSAFEFALELGQEWAERLVRMYPVRRK